MISSQCPANSVKALRAREIPQKDTCNITNKHCSVLRQCKRTVLKWQLHSQIKWTRHKRYTDHRSDTVLPSSASLSATVFSCTELSAMAFSSSGDKTRETSTSYSIRTWCEAYRINVYNLGKFFFPSLVSIEKKSSLNNSYGSWFKES